jgi:hypothetical protein
MIVQSEIHRKLQTASYRSGVYLIWEVYLLKRNRLSNRVKLQEDLTSPEGGIDRSQGIES